MKGQSEHLVFLPGMVCDERLWQWHMEQFEEEHDTEYVNLQLGQNIENYFDAIHDKIVPGSTLIGFSMGGYVATEYAIQFPERIKKLILVGSDPRGFTQAKIKQRERLIKKAQESTIDLMPDEQLKFYLYKDFLSTPAASLTQQMAHDAGQEVYIHQMHATLYRENKLTELQKTGLPVHSIMGEDDKIAPPKDIDALKKAGIQLEVLKQCGHMIPLEQPDLLLHLLEDIIWD